MTIVYLGLGSNIGRRKHQLDQAIVFLSQYMKILQRSSYLVSKAQYEERQPDFLNLVVQGETTLPPLNLLQTVKKIEQRLGREPTKRFGPRTVDIDILYYGTHIIQETNLIIPHPLISERIFVLKPLCEIAPNFLCPRTQQTVKQMLGHNL